MNTQNNLHDKELLQRLLLISFILSLPIFYLIYVSYINFNEKNKLLEFEISGVKKTDFLISEFTNSIIKNNGTISQNALVELNPEKFQNDFELNAKELAQLYQIDLHKQYRTREELSEKVYLPMIRLTANYSKLILDANLDTYYLMDIMSLKYPEILAVLSNDSGFISIEKTLLQIEKTLNDMSFSVSQSRNSSSDYVDFKNIDLKLNELKKEFQYQYNNNQKFSTTSFALKLKELSTEIKTLLIKKLLYQKNSVKDYYKIVLTLTLFLWILAIVLSAYLYFSLVKKKIEATEKIIEQERLLFQSEKLSSLGEMAGVIVHEIKNPLTIIDYESNLLVRKIDKNEVELTKIREKLIRVSEMTNRINKLSNLLTNYTRDNYDEVFDWVSLNDIFSEVNYITSLKAKKFNIKITYNESDIKIKCNQFQIEQIFINLINNSIDAISEKTDRWINLNAELVADKSIVRFEVVDSGNGIPKEVAEKMFNSFFTTKKTGMGTGLGLAITTKIVTQHHGRIYYDDSSKNTKIVVEMPAV